MVASELELYLFKESFAEARAKRYHGLTPVSSTSRTTTSSRRPRRRALVRAIRNGMEAAAVPVEFSKGEWGCGQEEINLRYAEPLEMADRHTLYKHGVKEIAHAQGSSVTFMAKYDMGAAGSSFHLHSSLWDRTGKKSLFYEQGPARSGSAALRPLARRTDGDGARVRLLLRALRQLLQALPGGLVRARRGSWPAGTTGPAASGSAARARASASRTGSPAPTPIPTSPSPRPSRPGSTASQKKLQAPKIYEGNAYEDAKLPQVPKTLREAIAELERSRVAREAFGDEVVEHYLHTARLEQQAFDQVGDRLGADAGLRAHLRRTI